jgi:hypothetical protein
MKTPGFRGNPSAIVTIAITPAKVPANRRLPDYRLIRRAISKKNGKRFDS